MKAVLVGGAGFIGHHTALEMAKCGIEPTIIDSFGINNLYALKPEETWSRAMIQERTHALDKAKVPVICMDARQYQMLSEAISALRPDIILHLAAVSHIDRSNKNPYNTLDHSLRTLENSLDIARALGTRFIYFSSSTVYGDFTSDVLVEESECKPKGIYGAMKLAGELLVNAYRDTYDLPTTIIRPCALYGPRCISRRVVQIFAENAFFGKPITVQGGDQREDFTYVEDLVDGILRVCQRDEAIGETFNITGGHARSLQELLNIIQSHLPGSHIEYTEKDPEKPHRGTMSVAKAKRLLGYEPSHRLETGLEKYVAWLHNFSERQNGPKNQPAKGRSAA